MVQASCVKGLARLVYRHYSLEVVGVLPDIHSKDGCAAGAADTARQIAHEWVVLVWGAGHNQFLTCRGNNKQPVEQSSRVQGSSSISCVPWCHS